MSNDPVIRYLQQASGDEIAEARRQIKEQAFIIKVMKRQVDRWVPCPDHRDKVSVDDECQVCRRERAERALQAVYEMAELLILGQDPKKVFEGIKWRVERVLNNTHA